MVYGNYVNVILHQNLEFLADNMHAARISACPTLHQLSYKEILVY